MRLCVLAYNVPVGTVVPIAFCVDKILFQNNSCIFTLPKSHTGYRRVTPTDFNYGLPYIVVLLCFILSKVN